MAVFTAALGFIVWYAQGRIQQHFDERTQGLTARLALTEECYRHKLTTYEKVQEHVANLRNSLNDVNFNPASKTVAIDSLQALYVSYTTNTLYLSESLGKQLSDLVDLGTHVSALDRSGKSTMGDIDKQVSLVEHQMKSDLRLEELGNLPLR